MGGPACALGEAAARVKNDEPQVAKGPPRLHKRIRGLSVAPDTGVTNCYSLDQSGTKLYTFNSLGFRGEELDLNAKKRIFACGCSMTFGEGLDLEETWPHRFKEKYANRYGYNAEEVNLLNFGEPGASNDQIVRTILPQCSVLRPDLLLIQFTYLGRTEYLSRSIVAKVGPWVIDKTGQEQDSVWLRNLRDPVKSYYAFYTNEWGFASAVKNILLVQSYCQAHAIRYLFWWVIDREKERWKRSENPVCVALHSLVDLTYFCDISVDILELDRAADKIHPGPRAHKGIADELFALHESSMTTRNWNQIS